MPVVTIENVGKFSGQSVTIQGWLYNLREAGKLLFPIFRDGTGTIQGVAAAKENPAAFDALRGLTQESSCLVTGTVSPDARAPGGYELHITEIHVVQRIAESDPYPIQLKEHGPDFLLENRHLWMRTPRQAAILRIRAQAEHAARNFMDSQGYVLTDAPMNTMVDELLRTDAVGSLLAVPPQDSFHVVRIADDGRMTDLEPVADMDMRINGGYFVLRQGIFDYLDEGEDLVMDACVRAARDGRFRAVRYDGFWAPMDTLKERSALEEMNRAGNRPWAVWDRTARPAVRRPAVVDVPEVAPVPER